MASQAMDNAEPPVFFGDRLDLAWAIGAPIRNEEAAQKAVQEVIKELRQDGAIVWSGQGRAGVKASYALALDFTHTWRPTGAGRKITWTKVDRADLPMGMQGKVVIPKSQGEKISPPEQKKPPKISPPKGEEIPGSQGEEISPERGRKSLPPTTRDYNSHFNKSIQSPASRLNGTRANGREGNGPQRLSVEEERNRQLDALEKIDPTIAARRKAS